MNAATRTIRKASEDGLTLGVSSAGKIAYRGPREAVARWLPALVANKSAIIAELLAPANDTAGGELTARRAAVEALLAEMEAENERRASGGPGHHNAQRSGRLGDDHLAQAAEGGAAITTAQHSFRFQLGSRALNQDGSSRGRPRRGPTDDEVGGRRS